MHLPSLQSTFLQTAGGLRRVLFPDVCLGCSVHVAQQGTLCPQCWGQLTFIERPYCEVLGTPFAHEFGDRIISAGAIANPPRYAKARAVAGHDGLAQRLVTRLKYADRTDLAPWMATWMVRAGSDLIAQSDIIIPVPLHRWRYWTRRYNQSAELARAIASQTGLPLVLNGLERNRATQRQVGLGAKARHDNVHNAFSVPEAGYIEIAGRSVLLIDDVITTGSTIDAACRGLQKANVGQINVLTFSRVLQNH